MRIKGYITVKEYARRKGLSVWVVQWMLRKGKIKGEKIGTIWFIREVQLDKAN